MEFNVAQLLKLPIGTIRTYEVDENVEGIEEPAQPIEVRGVVKMLRTREGILVQADLQTIVDCTCSRCLEASKCELALQFEEEYFPTIDVITGAPVEVPVDIVGFAINPNHMLSLDEAIRQYALLNHPMQPLCEPNCAGLCPECGANLNVEQCDCHLKAKDSPFSDLEKLLDTGDDLSASDERS